MKLLLSCVNSLVSLIGFDTEAGEAFWYLPANRIRSCGACYADNALLLASDNYLTRLAPDEPLQVRLPGPHHNLAHSIRPVKDGLFAVADTGNSRVVLVDSKLQSTLTYEPLTGLAAPPADAMHLNDIAVSPDALYASCFHFTPLPKQYTHFDWRDQGFGLVLELRRELGQSLARVVACGLCCPHSLVWRDGALYCCSSAEGRFLRLAPGPNKTFVQDKSIQVTSEHFLRGALPVEDGWYLGGSSRRHDDGSKSGMALFHLDEAGRTRQWNVAQCGEIYEILPWDDAVMPRITRMVTQLPAQEWDDQEYPPLCAPVA